MDNKSFWVELEKSLANLAKRYDWFTRLISFGFDKKVRKYISRFIDRDDIVLEVGSGPGTMAQYINCREYWGLEPLRVMIEIAKNRFNSKKFRFIQGVAEKIPFSSNKFDKVICAFSFRDFLSKVKALKEMYRVLKSGGALIILDLAKTSKILSFLREINLKFLKLLLEDLLKVKNVSGIQYFINSIKKFYRPEEIVFIAKKIGFREVYLEYRFLRTVFILVAIK